MQGEVSVTRMSAVESESGHLGKVSRSNEYLVHNRLGPETISFMRASIGEGELDFRWHHAQATFSSA